MECGGTSISALWIGLLDVSSLLFFLLSLLFAVVIMLLVLSSLPFKNSSSRSDGGWGREGIFPSRDGEE